MKLPMRLLLIFLILYSFPLKSSENYKSARFFSSESFVKENIWSETFFRLFLSHSVPYRVYKIEKPKRIVIEMQATVSGKFKEKNFNKSKKISSITFEQMGSGWNRIIANLNADLFVKTVGLEFLEEQDRSELKIVLVSTSKNEVVADDHGQKPLANNESFDSSKKALNRTERGSILVAIDPGHGGKDPGAIASGYKESELMLTLAKELKDEIMRNENLDVILTRSDDSFLSLNDRISLANNRGVDVFISLHADIVEKGFAEGVTIYTLSINPTDQISFDLAVRHNRNEILLGSDLYGLDDKTTSLLIDLAHRETSALSEALAKKTIKKLKAYKLETNRTALRRAEFLVLKSPEIPSILIEAGFLSTKNDLENLLNSEWRKRFATAVSEAIKEWGMQKKSDYLSDLE